MDVTNELEEVGFLLTHNGLITILKNVAHAAVPAIEPASMAGEQRAHGVRQRRGARLEK